MAQSQAQTWNLSGYIMVSKHLTQVFELYKIFMNCHWHRGTRKHKLLHTDANSPHSTLFLTETC